MTSDVEPPDVPVPRVSNGARVFIVALVLALVIFLVRACAPNHRLACMINQSRLAQILLARRSQQPDWTPRSGPGLFLEWRTTRTELKRGDEKILICPGDDIALPKTDAERSAWDHVDLDHPPRSLCSYAVRDFVRFPLDPKSIRSEPIAACVRHDAGAVILFGQGDVQFLSLAELGVKSEDEMTVGPDSKSPLLRVLRYGDGSVR